MLNQHRIDRDLRSNKLHDRRNVFAFERAPVALEFCVFQFADAQDLSVLPNPGVWIVGTDAPRIRPSVDRQQAIIDRGGDVHWPAVDADYETRDTNQPNKLEE